MEGVGNNTAIARKIQPEVEKYLYEKVTTPSISMALHRLSKSLDKPRSVYQLIENLSDVTVRSNLVEYIFPNQELSAELSKKLLAVSGGNDRFFTYSRGLFESAVVVQTKRDGDLQEKLQQISSVKRIDKLSAITIRLPEETLDVPGVYYPILKTFAQAQISFVEVISIATEFTILFEDKDIDAAFAELKQAMLSRLP